MPDEIEAALADLAVESQKQTEQLSEVIGLLSTIAGYLDEK